MKIGSPLIQCRLRQLLLKLRQQAMINIKIVNKKECKTVEQINEIGSGNLPLTQNLEVRIQSKLVYLIIANWILLGL